MDTAGYLLLSYGANVIELQADMWTLPADLYVITTNGAVKSNGACVMGRGCAQQARDMFPGIDKCLGSLLHDGNCNFSFYLGTWTGPDGVKYRLASYPVKRHWRERADLGLIRTSALDLMSVVEKLSFKPKSVILPRPGCGNGGLLWEEVKPVIEPILDDRFVVVSLP